MEKKLIFFIVTLIQCFVAIQGRHIRNVAPTKPVVRPEWREPFRAMILKKMNVTLEPTSDSYGVISQGNNQDGPESISKGKLRNNHGSVSRDVDNSDGFGSASNGDDNDYGSASQGDITDGFGSASEGGDSYDYGSASTGADDGSGSASEGDNDSGDGSASQGNDDGGSENGSASQGSDNCVSEFSSKRAAIRNSPSENTVFGIKPTGNNKHTKRGRHNNGRLNRPLHYGKKLRSLEKASHNQMQNKVKNVKYQNAKRLRHAAATLSKTLKKQMTNKI